MPREYVIGCEPILGTRDAVEVEGLVSVLWHADLEHVQVATVTRQAITHDTIEEGVHINLDRKGINDLIRNLRRARDKSFGRDE